MAKLIQRGHTLDTERGTIINGEHAEYLIQRNGKTPRWINDELIGEARAMNAAELIADFSRRLRWMIVVKSSSST